MRLLAGYGSPVEYFGGELYFGLIGRMGSGNHLLNRCADVEKPLSELVYLLQNRSRFDERSVAASK